MGKGKTGAGGEETRTGGRKGWLSARQSLYCLHQVLSPEVSFPRHSLHCGQWVMVPTGLGVNLNAG